MAPQPEKIPRRAFLLKTARMAAALAAANPLCVPLARAFSVRPYLGTPAVNEKSTISLIIDDVGYNRSRVLPFLELEVPLTFSILPRTTYAGILAEQIHAAGHEIMLHQPMQPHNHTVDPGPGALYLNQSPRERARIIKENIADTPFVAGVNNHMGSLFTESRRKVAEALKIFRERGFYFIDSYTSSHSVAFDTARKMHVSAAFRNFFIDNCLEKNYICTQLGKLKQHAREYGHAIGIGHPKPETVQALEAFLLDIDHSRFSIVYASRAVQLKQRLTA